MPRSFNKALNQVTSQVVNAIARYSASAEDRATTGYFLAFQETGEEPRKMQNPVVERRVVAQEAQSLSQYAVSVAAEEEARSIP